jgi:hypothetical protein
MQKRELRTGIDVHRGVELSLESIDLALIAEVSLLQVDYENQEARQHAPSSASVA